LLEAAGHIATEGRRGSFVAPAVVRGTGTFLVNIHRGSGANLTSLYEGFVQIAEQAGFKVRRRSTNPAPDSTLNRLPDPEALGTDTAGIALWPHYPTDAAKIVRLNERTPLVLVDQRVMGISADCVRFDDVTGGKLVTDHLLDIGHRHIAFLTDEVFAESVKSRWHGYVLAHEERGVPREPKHSLLYQLLDPLIFETTIRQLIAQKATRPTAIVCSNDLVAFRLLRFLHGQGIRVPEDVAVTGYGNAMPDYMAAIALTTVDQPFADVGKEAARLLCERAHQSSADRLRSPRDIVLPVKLVVRGSTRAA
jgi:DNA-binding LacI/PurR family transcriptional regulator